MAMLPLLADAGADELLEAMRRTDVEHVLRSQLPDDRQIRSEIAAVGIEGVVKRRQARMLERQIRH